MHRRWFVQSLAAVAGGLTLSRCAPSGSTPPASTGLPAKIGLQLYTVRTLINGDVEAVLEQVAGVGYKYIETDNLHDLAAAEFKAKLDAAGLQAVSGHFGTDLFRAGAEAVLEDAATLGMTYAVVPSIPEAERGDIDAWKRTAAWFNELGAMAKAAGLQFGYHNHAFEFEPIGGQVPYDILLAETDPDLVALELDLAWCVSAGYDPLALFERTPGRYRLWHLKDLTADKQLADVGAGTIDFAALFRKAEQAGVQYGFVEHDSPTDPLVSIKASFDYLAGVSV